MGGGGVRPQAEPPTHFTNLLWVRSTSVTYLITNLSRQQPFLAKNRHFQWIPSTVFSRRVYLGLKVCRHVTSMLRRDWLKLVEEVIIRPRGFTSEAYFVLAFPTCSSLLSLRRSLLILRRNYGVTLS